MIRNLWVSTILIPSRFQRPGGISYAFANFLASHASAFSALKRVVPLLNLTDRGNAGSRLA